MEFDYEKIDEMTLALLWLTSFKQHGGRRAWKGHDWDTMDRLYSKGYISDPKSKAKSVMLTDKGYAKAKQLFEAKYAKKS